MIDFDNMQEMKDYLLQHIHVGDIITKQIEEGHCIITYRIKVTSIDTELEDEEPYICFFGDPATDDDEDDVEEYGCSCGMEDILLPEL